MERNLTNLFEQTKQLVSHSTGYPVAKIIFTYVPFVKFE